MKRWILVALSLSTLARAATPPFPSVIDAALLPLEFDRLGADDFETRVAAEERLKAKLRGPQRGAILQYARNLLCHESDAEVLYRVDRILGRRESQTVPRSLVDTYRALYDPKYAITLVTTAPNAALEAYALAARLSPAVKEERKALERMLAWEPKTKADRADWNAELRRLARKFAAQDVRLEDLENGAFFRSSKTGRAIHVEFRQDSEALRWRPGKPLMAPLKGREGMAAFPFCFGQAPRAEAADEFPLWDVLIDIRASGDDDLTLTPHLKAEDFGAFLARSFRPEKGASEGQWIERTKAVQVRSPQSVWFKRVGEKWSRVVAF